MKWVAWGAGLLLAGCADVSTIESRPASMDVTSGKSVKDYTACLLPLLSETRRPSRVEGSAEYQRIIVPQKVSTAAAAIIYVKETSRGSNIVLHERMANNPLRPRDIRTAVKDCIS
ncbi:hypothetical protein IQ22_03155 [Pseudomonas duriflava]|uniref:Lipoprotein n=1 Tax=Pseudomonas duriflava TaxID=459528 RepID=A0A562Q7S1_9PSED|nr:hypothetical protein [Pseudomonas duriflava]TWI52779.1 hypothetical protein IQ22_03155 [Pseudomonas duriflava]